MPVLIVDDDRHFAFAVAAMLEHAGIEVEVAHSGTEVFEKLQAGLRPRIVLLDLIMQPMSGREVLAKLRDEFPGIPVAVLSGYPATEQDLDEAAPDVQAEKPISREDLLALIEKYGLPEIT